MITFLLVFIIFFVVVSVPCGIFVFALESKRRDAREAKEKQKATQDERRELSEDEIKFIQEYRRQNESKKEEPEKPEHNDIWDQGERM